MNEDSRKWIYWAIPVAVVIGLGVALYYGRKHQQQPAEQAAPSTPAPVSTEPAIKHPLPQESDETRPLPPLAESDGAVQESLGGVFGGSLDPFLVPQNLVRNFVVTVDNLPRKKTAVQMRPVKPTGGQFVTSGADRLTIGADNYARYAPLVKIVQSADSAQLVALYKRFYPLLQQAYVDLGYPDGYFNDRLIEVIDHLLETPEVSGPIRLTQPGVFYQFADASLEERSAGQKLLIRMGGENAAAIKAKLREIRKLIASEAATAAP